MPELLFDWERFNVYVRPGEIEVLDCFAQPQQRVVMPLEFVRWLASLLPADTAPREAGMLREAPNVGSE